MYTRESINADRYNNGDDTGSGCDETQNTTAVSSDWSVRPSDDAVADPAQTNGLSRLNPAAVPFSFTGGAGTGGSSGGAGEANVGGGPAGTGVPGNGDLGIGAGGQHGHARPGLLAGGSLDGGMTPPGMAPNRGLGPLNGSSSNGGGGGMGGLDMGGPTSFGVMQGMMAAPYRLGGGHRQASLPGRPGGMMDFGVPHGGLGSGPDGVGLDGMNPGHGGGRMGGVGGGITSPNSFLPPPGEDTDQQELLRLQQSNYRVKMLPPPLTYEVHRKMWSKNEYGDDNDDEMHGSVEQQEEESLHSLVNEDPIDKEQRLEAYKQIMLRWYSHIHVLESKSEVAKRLVRVRRACPSMEEVMAGLSNQQQQQQQSGAATNTTGSEGGDDDATPSQQQQQQPPAAFSHRSPSEPLDTEEVLASWSAQCWDWWQETVKRKPRRARKQGEMPLADPAVGLPTSASAPMVAAMEGSVPGDGTVPHSLSARAMDAEASSPHVGDGSPYTRHSPYASHANGSSMDAAAAAAAVAAGLAMPKAPSYTSFTDLSEDGGVDLANRSAGQSSQPAAAQSRTSSHSSPQLQAPPSQHSQVTSHNATPPASMFTTNGIRAAAPRSGNPDDFLENDHLALAFTTELLKSLEE